MKDEEQLVVMIDRNRHKEKVTYRSSGWMPKGMGHVSEVNSTKLTRSEPPHEAEGGPRLSFSKDGKRLAVERAGEPSRGVAAPSSRRKVSSWKAELIAPSIQKGSELSSSVNSD